MSLDGHKIAGDWNDLAVDLRFEGVSRAGAKIPMGPPTQDGVRKEILARYPETPMRIVGRPMSNSLGPFGLAVGAVGDVRCAFAWQWVDDIRARAGGFRNWFQEKTPASIRLRLCRSGVTADELASIFERLEVTDSGALDRIVTTWKEAPESEIAASGATSNSSPNLALTSAIVPDTTLEASLFGNRPKAPIVVKSMAPTKPIAVTKSITATKPIAVTKAAKVSARPRHRLGRRVATPHVVQTAPSSVPPQGGRQYLAPTDTQTGRDSTPAKGAAARGQARLDPGLPAQAYLGPLSQSQPRAAVGASGAAPRYLGADSPAQ